MKELFEPWGGLGPDEEDLEARLVALVAGEASEFERDALERLMVARPEVAAWKERLELLHGVVQAAVRPHDSEWKLSPQRRSLVMATLRIGEDGNGGKGEACEGERERRDGNREWRIAAAGRRVLWAAAACVLINVLLFAWLVGTLVQRKGEEAMESKRAMSPVTTYGIDAESEEEGAPKEGDFETRIGSAAGSKSEAPPRPAKPAASSKAKAVRRDLQVPDGPQGEAALATVKPQTEAAPVPLSGLAPGPAPELALDRVQASDVTPDSDPFGAVGKGLTHFDVPERAPSRPQSAAAAEIPRRESRQAVPVPDNAGEPSLDFGSDESFGSGWGAGGGGLGGEDKARRIVELGDDPVRTNPASSDEAGKEDGKPGQNLERADGYKDLGLYDEAIGKYQEALWEDPHQSAARRGMEEIHRLKSDTYRSAYDESRARQRGQVDEGWEMVVPPASTPAPAGGRPGETAEAAPDGRDGRERDGIMTRRFKVPPTFLTDLQHGGGEGEDDPFGDDGGGLDEGTLQARRPVEEILKEAGVEFPPGASVQYVPGTEELIVSNTVGNLDLVSALTESLSAPVPEEPEPELELEVSAAEQRFSTFSLHVSEVSFKLAKAALERGEWPAAGELRVEEFVNAFDYGDPAPGQDEKVTCRVEQAAHPFMQQRNLVRIGMRTAALGRAGGTPLSLTVLLDHSGSMERLDRVESVRRAFDLLAAQLTPQDRITVIGFARTPRLLADRIPGDEAGTLSSLVASTPSGGGTNLEEALRLGLSKAMEQKVEGGQNRIILLTDGAANLGNARPEDLALVVERMRQSGLAFDACGVGADGLNDKILESLTRKGDGRYYFLDRPEDADAGFARQIAGALRPAAKNVKVQVEFNPERVGRYKLFGFDKHRLETEDFRDDTVDAAEMAAEEAGNAVYQVEVRPDGVGPIGSVSVRFQDMTTGRMVERQWTIPYDGAAPRLGEASPSMRLAGSAALLGEKLDGSAIGERVRMGELISIAAPLRSDFPASERVGDLLEMIGKARELAE